MLDPVEKAIQHAQQTRVVRQRLSVIDSIYQEPDQWFITDSGYRFVHRGLSTEIWIGNGFFYYGPHPNGSWGLAMKWKFAKAFRWWSENRPVN